MTSKVECSGKKFTCIIFNTAKKTYALKNTKGDMAVTKNLNLAS